MYQSHQPWHRRALTHLTEHGVLLGNRAQCGSMFLVGFHQQHMPSRLELLLKALELMVGLLNTPEASLPGAETQNNDSQENESFGRLGQLNLCTFAVSSRRNASRDGS